MEFSEWIRSMHGRHLATAWVKKGVRCSPWKGEERTLGLAAEFVYQGFEFVHIFKAAVDAGKPHIRYFVQFF